MLSRRNIRVKVMQVLYAMNRDPDMGVEEGLKIYRFNVNRSYDLYLFNLLYLFKIAAYSLKELDKRKSKLLPSEEDKAFRPLLWENPLTQFLHSNEGLQKLWKKKGLLEYIDSDNLRNYYSEFAREEDYKTYQNKAVHTESDHRNILQLLFKTCIRNESFCEIMEDHFPSWPDDQSLVTGAVKKTLKAIPGKADFHRDFLPEEEATKEFGETLLRKTVQKDQELLKTIEPTLQNWDADRVAILDMVILKMAVCELLHFPTIPTKVTLNEFVEISKVYSTDKSKDFINGILDRLMKQLSSEGAIKKEGRGLIE